MGTFNQDRTHDIMQRQIVKLDYAPSFRSLTSGILPEGTKVSAVAPWVVEAEPGPSMRPRKSRVQRKPNHPMKPDIASLRSSSHPANPLVTLLVGRHDPNARYLIPQLFQIPVSSLCKAGFFAKYKPWEQHGVQDSTLIRLADLDPNAFELYYEYICTGTIVFPRRIGMGGHGTMKWSWQGCWPLINASILATTLEDPKFSDYIFSLLKEKLQRGQLADLETIKHVFTTPDIDVRLKHFVLDEAIDSGFANFEINRLAGYPTFFLKIALRRMMKRLSEANLPNVTLGSEVSAPRARNNANELLDPNITAIKEIKDQLRGIITTRDNTEARGWAQANGVETTDWAERRAATSIKAESATQGRFENRKTVIAKMKMKKATQRMIRSG